MASRQAPYSSSLKALCFSGRLREMTATPSTSSRRTTSDMGSACQGRRGKVEQFPGVELDDAMGLVVGTSASISAARFAGVGPVGVGVGVVAFPRQPIDADRVAEGEARLVIDETAPDVAVEQVGRAGVLVDLGVPAVPFQT